MSSDLESEVSQGDLNRRRRSLGLPNILQKLERMQDKDESDWEDFDDRQEKQRKEMVDSLKGQLNNLLLFATLFSAINSAFLVFSLPSMSSSATSPSLYSATSLANILFSCSLIGSMVSSFGAAQGQQWILFYSRQPDGSSKDMRRDRHRKILAARRWYLRPILEAVLPTILQGSLVTFVIGLIVYLQTISQSIASFTAAFACIGLVALFIVTFAALWDPDCPFQTPLTLTVIPSFIRLLYGAGVCCKALWLGALHVAGVIFISRNCLLPQWGLPADDNPDAFKDIIGQALPIYPIQRVQYRETRSKLARRLQRAAPSDDRLNAEVILTTALASRTEKDLLTSIWLILGVKERNAVYSLAQNDVLVQRLSERFSNRLTRYIASKLLSTLFASTQAADDKWFTKMADLFLQELRTTSTSQKILAEGVSGRVACARLLLYNQAYDCPARYADLDALRYHFWASVPDISERTLDVYGWAVSVCHRVSRIVKSDPSRPHVVAPVLDKLYDDLWKVLVTSPDEDTLPPIVNAALVAYSQHYERDQIWLPRPEYFSKYLEMVAATIETDGHGIELSGLIDKAENGVTFGADRDLIISTALQFQKTVAKKASTAENDWTSVARLSGVLASLHNRYPDQLEHQKSLKDLLVKILEYLGVSLTHEMRKLAPVLKVCGTILPQHTLSSSLGIDVQIRLFTAALQVAGAVLDSIAQLLGDDVEATRFQLVEHGWIDERVMWALSSYMKEDRDLQKEGREQVLTAYAEVLKGYVSNRKRSGESVVGAGEISEDMETRFFDCYEFKMSNRTPSPLLPSPTSTPSLAVPEVGPSSIHGQNSRQRGERSAESSPRPMPDSNDPVVEHAGGGT